MIARGRGDIDKAEAHCREALQDLAGERYGTRLQCLSTLSNLAVTRGDFWQARNYNRDALSSPSATATRCSRRWSITTAPASSRRAARWRAPRRRCARA